ncbi:MAG: hypothetical protein IJW24_04680, partial [Clostridia bacterium]|nr:hypothetical protein [Clostridia bacterium]
MKKEHVSQMKIEESQGQAFVVEEKNCKKAIKKKQKAINKQEKANKKAAKLAEKQKKNQEIKQEKLKQKNLEETKKINYFKKLAIIRQITKERKEKEKAEAAEYDKRMSALYKKQKTPPWLRLDNAGTIYPSAERRHWNFVYRISAVTYEKVDAKVLAKAVEDILPRFPSFNVCLKRGLFWNYFERAPRKLVPVKDNDFPCQKFDLSDTNANLIRVIYDDFKICFECFHALADGRGSLMFLNSLLGRYFELLGHEITDDGTILSCKDMPRKEEIEDSFLKYYEKDKASRPKEKAAYKIKGTNLGDG